MKLKKYKYKRKMIIFLMLFGILAMLSLTAVSAANHTVSGSNFNSIESIIDSSSSGDTISLGYKTYTGSGSAMTVTGNKNITIQGQSNINRATLDANNLHGILYISEGSSVTIRYVNFVDGGNTANALSAHGTVRIENCSFISSEGDSGSAIYVHGTATNSIIRNCNFTNNYANNKGVNVYTAGGAVCIDNANNVNITNCNFSGNKALNHGGALVIRNDAINVRITNCNFIKNQAPNGGAIAIISSTVIISGCTFTNNSATNNGGGIYTTGSIRSTITGSKFTGNSAKYGGGIYNNAPLAISTSNFVSNKASANGGAIYANKNLNISGGSIKSNTANYGSGIYNVATLRLVKLPSLSKNSESPTAMLLNVKSTVKPGTKLNIQAALKKKNNVKGINGVYSTNTNVFKGNTRLTISNYVSNQKIFFTISGKTYKKNSGKTGIAKYSLKTAKKNYKIKITAKTSYNKKTFKKFATVTVKKPKTSTKTTSTGSSSSSNKVTINYDEDRLYINGTFNINQLKKINSKTISYHNVKKANNIVNKYYYYVDNTGWYLGKKGANGKFDFKEKISKPSSSGNWYNVTYSYENSKITINDKTTSFKDAKSNRPQYFFVIVNKPKTSNDLRPHVLNTYNITKTDGTTKLVNIYETATTDIYFSSLGFNSSKLKNELTYKDSRVQVNASTFKNFAINIFQGKAGYGSGIEGELTSDKKIRAIYKWVSKTVYYHGYSNSHYKATDVLWRLINGKKKTANCVDQAIFWVTILRTVGVPAYFEHNWAFGGHVVVKAYYTNTKKYTLDTTSSRNNVDVIKNWNPKTTKIKSGPWYSSVTGMYVHTKTTYKDKTVGCCLV